MTTIISLVSDQPMPNVLFIKQMPRADRYVFLTTQRMEEEGKSDNILKVCGIDPNKVDHIIAHHEDVTNILEEWKHLEDRPGEHYHINLTGGTKMMALGTFSHFTTHFPPDRVSVHYVQLSGGNIQQMYPVDVQQPMQVSISVQDYLDAHGVKLLSAADWLPWEQEARKVFRHVSKQQTNYQIQSRLLESRTNPAELEFVSLSPEERSFYSGKWLEVWLAAQVRDLLGIPASEIIWDARVNKSGAAISMANEYDVLFVYNNRLYLGECKHFTSKNDKKLSSISKELFKMGGANNLTGLNAKPFFAIVGSLLAMPEEVDEQCRMLRLRPPAFLDTLKDPIRLQQFFRSL
ncbi:MAG: DUF1887 family CARF protein [Bacteroidia bacterium]|nr:DUF1887 family CARF protein [Bacteroidia bacterium]